MVLSSSSLSHRLHLLFAFLLLFLASPSMGKKADWSSRYLGNWRMNVFCGSKKTGVLSGTFDTLFLSLNDYDSAANTLSGICYMEDGRHFLRIEMKGPGAGTIYTAPETAAEKAKSSVIATITSDEGDVYAIENYSSFDLSELSFHELLSFEMRNCSNDFITSHGSFVNLASLIFFFTKFCVFWTGRVWYVLLYPGGE